MTQPASTGLLADDLFFVVHDSAAGRPGLHPRTVGFGLAGALLGELALDRRISVEGDPAPLRVVDRTPPSDQLPLQTAEERRPLSNEFRHIET